MAEVTVPSNPEISIVTDAKGNLFFLLHEKGYSSDDLMFYKTTFRRKQENPSLKS